MAMALKSNLAYSGIAAGIQASECWSSTNWEPEGLTEGWEREDPAMEYPSRQGDGEVRTQGNEWAAAACSVVTLASSGGGSKSGGYSHQQLSGSSTPSGTSISSGIPGVAAGGGSRVSDLVTLLKNEPDDGQAEQVVASAPECRGGQKDRFFFSLGRSLSRENEEGPVGEEERTQPAGGQSDGSSVMSGGGDSQNVTLKLGRRTYYEDPGAGGQAKACSALLPPGKKQRPLSSSAQIPRCQVEGCKADLSGCKDYHKRHKVCEMHSKAPKAIAAGIEQRFCQQCSRFHVLKEFDDGKRSCRRRLAGHNERRRKPHPETHSLFGLGNPFLHTEISTPSMRNASFYFPEDSKPSSFLHPHRGSAVDYGLHGYGQSLARSSPWALKSRNDNIPTFQLENLKTPMTSSKAYSGMNLGGHHFLEGPLGPLGQGLSLSSSTGGVLGSLEQSRLGSCSQALSSVSGMMDSGRALSLLSSQSWASRPPPGAPAPASVGLSQAADSTLEQLVASSSDSSSRGSRFAHQLRLPCGGSPATGAQQQFDTQFSVQSGGLGSVALNCGLTATGNGTHGRRGCGNGGSLLASLEGYEQSNPMLGLVGGGQDLEGLGSGFGGPQGGRPTIDLMQIPPVQAHHGSHSSQGNGGHSGVTSVSGGQYSGFSSLRPFESSIFTSQQLL